MIIDSQKLPLAIWILMSQKQDFLKKHLAQVPIAPNQLGTADMWDEVISNVGAQDLVKSGDQVSNLEDLQFHMDDLDWTVDTVFQLSLVISFSHLVSNNCQKDSLSGNLVVIDKD